MNTSDPSGARARFLAAIEKTSERGNEPVRLCEACLLALPVQRTAISVQVDGVGLEVLCASDAIAERIEWAQVTLGEGPGVDAVASGGPVAVPELARAEGRWPMFAAEALESGVRAMYALPLQVGAIRVGVLDLYPDAVVPLDNSDFADALVIADLVTAILLSVGRFGWVTEPLGPWWDQPLSTRQVHQATGMIMAQLEVPARDAYVRLQAFAYARQRLLGDVAHDVVHRSLRFDTDPDEDLDPDLNPLTSTH